MADTQPISSQKAIRRKIQVVGGNTITVSLPRAWADRNRLGREAHQEQEIVMRSMADGSLLLSPANTGKVTIERERSHRINNQTPLDKVKRIMLGDFMGGIDIIKFRTKDELSLSLVNEIRNFVDKRLIGFDLIEYTEGFDVINMTQSPRFSVDKMLEIIRVQSAQMMQKCFAWLDDSSIDRQTILHEMYQLESSLDKRSNQMMRTLQLSILDYWMAENVELPMEEILYWSTTIKATENASDLAVAIIQVAQNIDLSKIDDTIVNDIYKLAKVVTDMFSTALKAFIEHDFEMAHNLIEEQDRLSITTQTRWPIAQIQILDGSMLLIVRHLEKISVYSRKIAESAIDCESARVASAANSIV